MNDMSDADKAAESVLADIERSEKELLALCPKMMLPGTSIRNDSLFLFGVARRTLAQSSAFRAMVTSKNSLVAVSILRMQLDTVLRLYALFWVADPNAFALQVLEGKEIKKIRAKDGEFMTDRYLIRKLEGTYEWIGTVYKASSGYIHFSNTHIRAAVSITDPLTGHGQLVIGPHDTDKTISYYGEILRNFLHLNLMIPVAMDDAFQRISNNIQN